LAITDNLTLVLQIIKNKNFKLFGCIDKEEEKEKKYLLKYLIENILVTYIFLNKYLWKNTTIHPKVEKL